MSGAIGTLIDIFRFLQVENIASMFDLDPNRPIWIVKKGGNIPVRTRGGQLYGPLVVPSAVYDVRSHPPTTAEGAATSSAGSGQLDTTYPFGAFMFQKVTRACPVSSSPMKRGGTRQSCATPSWTMTALMVRPSGSQHERCWLPTRVFTN